MRRICILFFLPAFILLFSTCKKETVEPTDFSSITQTNAECLLTGKADSTDWNNDVLNYALDTQLLTFTDTVVTTDSVAGIITMSPPCPNPSNGFFIWNVTTGRQCKMRLVCINEKYEILYYNVYRLNGGPVEIGFDFRSYSAFKKNAYYRMFYAFYNSVDSLYYAGHGDFEVQ